MAENKNLENEKSTETVVTYSEEKPKKTKKRLLILMILILLGVGGYFVYEIAQSGGIEEYLTKLEENKAEKEREKTSPKPLAADTSGRYIDWPNTVGREQAIEEKAQSSRASELKKTPYKNKVTPYTWASSVTISINGEEVEQDSMELYEIYTDGARVGKAGTMTLNQIYIGLSARVKEDELVNPNQEEDFNEFATYVEAFDTLSNKTLSEEEVEEWAQKAENLARNDKNPATLYIGELIRNLKGKNPTEASIRYLMYANRIYPDKILGGTAVNLEIKDMSKYLDTSHAIGSMDDYVMGYVEAMERPNNDEYLGIAHRYFDGSLNTYQIYDIYSSDNSYPGKNTGQEGQSTILIIDHYKDISNRLIAEYGIMACNVDWAKMGLDRASYSRYKPSYTWNIYNGIEEICSAYYDLVEPDVYQGKFTTRADYYKKTADKLGKTVEEVKSAVLTYEYWALSRGKV